MTACVQQSSSCRSFCLLLQMADTLLRIHLPSLAARNLYIKNPYRRPDW
jgi:hypothetical protein